MSSNFKEAAKRHYEDARYLRSDNRQPNAGQLFGFSAECGIKALLVGLGHPTDASGGITPAWGLRGHIHQIHGVFGLLNQFGVDSRQSAKYHAMVPHLGDFSDWHTDHRYASAAEILLPLVEKWDSAAQEVLKMVQEAEFSGDIK